MAQEDEGLEPGLLLDVSVLIRAMFNVAALIVLHKQIGDHALDLLRWLQIVVALKVEPDHVHLVQTDLPVNKFHRIFVFTVAVVITDGSTLLVRLQVA